MELFYIPNMKAIGYITTTLALIIYAAMMNGWALAKLWTWFVMPTLSAPPLSIPAAIGICYIVHFFKPVSGKMPTEKWSETLTRGIVVATLNPLVTVGLARIVKIWM